MHRLTCMRILTTGPDIQQIVSRFLRVGGLTHKNMLVDIGGHNIDDYTENITMGMAGSGVSFVNDPFSASSGTRYFISLPFLYGACVQFCIQWSTGNLAIRSREVSSQGFKEWKIMK